MAVKTPSLRELQQEIKTFILENKEGSVTTLPKHEYGRLSIYRDLIYNMTTNFFGDVFPLSYKFLKSEWRSLVKEYYSKYTPDDPILVYMAYNFPLFIQEKGVGPAYLAELALYEWCELEVSICKPEEKEQGINPAHLVIDFEYPVTDIAIEIEKDNLSYEPEQKKQQILFYRDPETLLVKTFVLAPTTAIAIEMLDNGASLGEIALKVKEAFSLPNEMDEKLRTDLSALIASLQDKGILLK